MVLDLAGIFKILILIGIVVYLVFAFIVVKQVKIMNATLKTGMEFLIRTSAYLHLAFAVLVFLFALFAL